MLSRTSCLNDFPTKTLTGPGLDDGISSDFKNLSRVPALKLLTKLTIELVEKSPE